jgi:hypothetical protein
MQRRSVAHSLQAVFYFLPLSLTQHGGLKPHVAQWVDYQYIQWKTKTETQS